ncbi:MAG: hypothetical protein Q7S83_01780 [bacterium]|nr:hypothetical protein [bacterium]
MSKYLTFGAILAVIISAGLFSLGDPAELGQATLSVANKKTENVAANPSTSGAGFVIKMSDAGYDKLALEIKQGDTVTFENTGTTKYRWPASNIHPTHQIYSEFDPKKKMAPGESWSFTFNKPGTWKFHDHLAPGIVGDIKVIPVAGAIENIASEKVEPKKSVPKPTTKTETDFASINIMAALKDNEQLTKWLNAVGPKKIMEKLLKDTNGGSLVDCHQESHTVGRLAFKIYGASAFGDGNSSCHSGYYHGAMEELLKEKGTANLSKTINDVCDTFNTSFGRFECLHGVGHGVLAYDNYDLPKAIKTCRLLKDDYSVSSCYGGMFMENIITGQGSGGSKDHDTEWVSKDPQFPCNAIDQDHEVQYQCYQMQTSWMLTLFSYDFNKVSEECLKSRPDMVEVCFKSYGRDAAGHTLRNPQKIKELCGKIPDIQNYYYICVVGAVNVVVDFWGDLLTTQATELCQILPETGKRSCYTTLASRLLDVFNTPERRKLICDGFEADYKNLCLAN